MKKQNQNLIKIVKLLSTHDFCDGTSLGKQLNITRSAVWKVIKKLEAYQIPIQSIKGKGYSILEPLILLEQEKIESAVNSNNFQIDIFESIDSTNSYLSNTSFKKNINICLAEMQARGKGRFQRQWHSPFGKNLYFSMRYPFNNDISELAGLSLITALATCHALERCYQLPHQAMIKWPNDIIVDGQKLSGSLIELQAQANDICDAIIGIGINVNMQSASDDEISKNWTSVLQLTKQFQDRNELAIILINSLLAYIDKFKKLGLIAFLDEWKQRDNLFGKSIKLKNMQYQFEGIGQGINGNGHLILKLDDGSIKAFSSGETTLNLLAIDTPPSPNIDNE